VCVFKTLDRYNLSIIGRNPQYLYLVATCVPSVMMVAWLCATNMSFHSFPFGTRILILKRCVNIRETI
jgi:hypothetical protein